MAKYVIGMLLVLGLIITALVIINNKPKPIATLPPPQYIPPWIPPQVPTEPPAPEVWTVQQALDSLTSAELKEHLEYLASDELEGRMSGKKGNVKAFAYLKDFHEKNGMKTEYQKFNIRRLNPGPHNERGDDFTQNLFAYIEGSDPTLKNEVVVVGAHGDHIGYGPSMSRSSSRREVHNGADDNASGTVVVQLVARAFQRLDPKEVPRTIVFQHYSAEEMGLIGARYYCNKPTFPKGNPNIKSHVAMINLDMVGYLGKGHYFAGFYSGNSSIDLGKYIDELNRKYTFAKKITSRGGGGSDHACFYNKRVPVAFLHTGGHSYYHTPDDDAHRLNFDGMEKISKYTFELAYKIVNANVRPKFNHAEFKEMPYVHDHGHPEVPFIHSYHKDEYERLKRHGHFHEHNHPHPHEE
tara:strand:+ start:4796 stop:6025 length:1230 start_codon:yes stop_codon:yes gene_type:complete